MSNTNADNRLSPLLINNIIYNISIYLTNSEIKQYRLVCKQWNYTLLKLIGNNIKFNLKPNLTYLIEGRLLSLEVLSKSFILDLRGLGGVIKGFEGEIWVNQEIFQGINDYFGNLRALDLMPPLNCMDKLSECLPILNNLSSLTIRHRYLSQLNNLDQCNYYNLPSNISQISLDYSNSTHLTYFPNLESSQSLESIELIINCTIKTKTELPFNALNNIKLFKTNQIDHKLSIQLLSLLNNLKSLDIQGKCPSQQVINNLSSQNQSLESINFTSHLSFNINSYNFSLFANLKELRLNSKLSYTQLVQISNSCQNLQVLKFKLINFTNPICSLFESQFITLKYLDISECEFNWSVENKWKCSNKLEVLRVSELRDLAVLDWFYNLRVLFIQRINTKHLDYVRAKFGYLKFNWEKVI
ncbi:hypothetical protein CONCODRAFT_77152, partial [Conidiobolus coronatus NRRL 28638]